MNWKQVQVRIIQNQRIRTIVLLWWNHLQSTHLVQRILNFSLFCRRSFFLFQALEVCYLIQFWWLPFFHLYVCLIQFPSQRWIWLGSKLISFQAPLIFWEQHQVSRLVWYWKDPGWYSQTNFRFLWIRRKFTFQEEGSIIHIFLSTRLRSSRF